MLRRLVRIGVFGVVGLLVVGVCVGVYAWWIAPDGAMPGLFNRQVRVLPTPEFDVFRGRMKALSEGVSEARNEALGEHLSQLWEEEEGVGAGGAAFQLSDAERGEIAALVAEFQERELPDVPAGHWFGIIETAGFLNLVQVYAFGPDVSADEACRAMIATMNLVSAQDSDFELGALYGLGISRVQMMLGNDGKLLKASPVLLERLRERIWTAASPETPPEGLIFTASVLPEGLRRRNDADWRRLLPDGCLGRYAAKVDAELRANRLLELATWLQEQPQWLNLCAEYRNGVRMYVILELLNRSQAGMLCTVISGALHPGGLAAYLAADVFEGIDYRRDPFDAGGGRFQFEQVGGRGQLHPSLAATGEFDLEPWEVILELPAGGI